MGPGLKDVARNRGISEMNDIGGDAFHFYPFIWDVKALLERASHVVSIVPG
jgi:hypothetical protein